MTDNEALECAQKLRRYCENKDSCVGCPFHDDDGQWYICKLERQPDGWELPEEGNANDRSES